MTKFYQNYCDALKGICGYNMKKLMHYHWTYLNYIGDYNDFFHWKYELDLQETFDETFVN